MTCVRIIVLIRGEDSISSTKTVKVIMEYVRNDLVEEISKTRVYCKFEGCESGPIRKRHGYYRENKSIRFKIFLIVNLSFKRKRPIAYKILIMNVSDKRQIYQYTMKKKDIIQLDITHIAGRPTFSWYKMGLIVPYSE